MKYGINGSVEVLWYLVFKMYFICNLVDEVEVKIVMIKVRDAQY